MSKFLATLKFEANVVIEARTYDEARAKAEDMLDERSVYEDDKLDVMHDEAFCAGGTGDDPPLRNSRAWSLRDENFTPMEVEVEEWQ